MRERTTDSNSPNAERESNAYLLEELYGVKGKPGSWQYRLTTLWLCVRAFFSFIGGAIQAAEYLLISLACLFLIGTFFYVVFWG